MDSKIPFSSDPKSLKRQPVNSWGNVQNMTSAGRQTTSVDTGKFAMLKRAATYLQTLAGTKPVTGRAFSEMVRNRKLTSLEKLRLYTGQMSAEVLDKTKTVKDVIK